MSLSQWGASLITLTAAFGLLGVLETLPTQKWEEQRQQALKQEKIRFESNAATAFNRIGFFIKTADSDLDQNNRPLHQTYNVEDKNHQKLKAEFTSYNDLTSEIKLQLNIR